MKKEEFLTKLKKNLSVLEEKEIQDIVEEYEQHIDMKMKDGMSEEEAIRDFGDLKELTAGILEAYHVKADYQSEKKNIDFDKVKEESRKATEKATTALGKGAGMVGKGAGAAGKWCGRQVQKILNLLKTSCGHIKDMVKNSREKSKGKGLLGRLWLLVLGVCTMVWKGIKWGVRLCWNLFWLGAGILMTFFTLCSIFLFGLTVVLLSEGYPLVGVLLVVIGSGLVGGALTLLCFSFIIRKRATVLDSGKDGQKFPPDEHQSKEPDESWEYPEGQDDTMKQVVINGYQEVLHHA